MNTVKTLRCGTPYATAFGHGFLAVLGSEIALGGRIDQKILLAATGAGAVAALKLAQPQPNPASTRI